jgi:hypothetical protein
VIRNVFRIRSSRDTRERVLPSAFSARSAMRKTPRVDESISVTRLRSTTTSDKRSLTISKSCLRSAGAAARSNSPSSETRDTPGETYVVVAAKPGAKRQGARSPSRCTASPYAPRARNPSRPAQRSLTSTTDSVHKVAPRRRGRRAQARFERRETLRRNEDRGAARERFYGGKRPSAPARCGRKRTSETATSRASAASAWVRPGASFQAAGRSSTASTSAR